MLKTKSYFLFPLTLFILTCCTQKQFHETEEMPLGIIADADSIIVFQHSVDNLNDSLTPNNLAKIQSYYFDNNGNISTGKITGLINGKVDYESISEIKRNNSHNITAKSTTVKDRFRERKIIETYLIQSTTEEIIETKYYMASELISCDTTRISYSTDHATNETCKNSVWIKTSEQIYEDNKLRTNYTYIDDNIQNSTKYTYDDNGRLRSVQSYVHNTESQYPIPQPPYTHTYILGKDGNPLQQVTVLAGTLLSISKIKIYHRTK